MGRQHCLRYSLAPHRHHGRGADAWCVGVYECCWDADVPADAQPFDVGDWAKCSRVCWGKCGDGALGDRTAMDTYQRWSDAEQGIVYP